MGKRDKMAPAVSGADGSSGAPGESIEGMAALRGFFELFEYLPNAHFFAKDLQSRYLYASRPVLRDVFGLDSLDAIVGKTDLDFQPPILAEAYHAEDRRVMESGRTIPNEFWLVPKVNGPPKWYLSTKTPLRDARGEVAGVMGVLFQVESPQERKAYFRELAPAVARMEAGFKEEISMEAMAKVAGLSSTQFNLKFRQLLRMSPGEYLLKLRIDAARSLLSRTEKPIAEIGSEVGFYDQSHFTKRFRKATGLSPNVYRKQFR